ncbi:hypothetical protein ABC382_00285 [Lysinibacillus sp. 1P01SD]|uniref:hypothetical protein n=1 Tax=Lysinibacillus sp. 1P01SD TaxID=3132285 RepID=UPI0039A2DFF7
MVIQEEKDGKVEVFENISHSQMLEHFSKHHDTAYRFKTYGANAGGFWELELVLEHGKTLKKQANPPQVSYGLGKDFSFADFFEKLANASPSRKENLGSLLMDVINNEDISKPKLTVVKND